MKDNVRQALDKLANMQDIVPDVAKKDFKSSLGTLFMQQALQDDYRMYDKMMDDAASDLTAMTKVDVRKQGIDTALEHIIGDVKTRAVMDAVRYEIAKALKGLIDE